MAVSTITYSNKVALNENQSVADINKVKADDMNEIKTVVNNNATETSKNTTDIANITGTILWTNPNPTSAFASQTITLSSDDYDMLEIFTSNAGSFKILKGQNTTLFLANGYGADHMTTAFRNFNYSSDTSYSISNEQHYVIATGGSITYSNNNSDIIPLYIIGYKTGLFS